MADADSTHVVIIPSYNPGRRLAQTVREALGAWSPVWVVSDGSTDGSDRALAGEHAGAGALRVLVRPENGGKGAAVLTAAEEALRAGFTHGLVMDADGQHPADRIADFMGASRQAPDAMILGRPVFGPEAPWIRLNGRKLSIALVTLELLGRSVGDPLFGFRVYPLAPLARVLRGTRGARRFDFDPEVAVRLTWAGVPALNLASSCRYLSRAEGGVSHFHYLSDNTRMAWMHIRLITELLLYRWPAALRARRRRLR
jgi:glycosyltransferase involved in cell wall biosynthesis